MGNIINQRILYLMRGIPGSGKSFTAKKLAGESGLVFSTDDFFVKDGVYKFDKQQISYAHDWNFARVKDAMNRGYGPVVVDNTNTTLFEARKYILAARNRGYDVEVREPESTWWAEFADDLQNKTNVDRWVDFFAQKNQHGVPAATIRKMIMRWEVFDCNQVTV